jgi:phage terminase large subunit-like protein
VFGDPDNGVQVEMHYFLPESAIKRRMEKDENSIYNTFEKLENVHICPGNTVDYNAVRRKISGNYFLDGKQHYDSDNISERFNLKGLAYDRWNSLSLIRDLTGDGVVCDPYGQGWASLSFPSKSLEKMALEGKLHHGGDEVLRWMMGNVVLKIDAAGNIKPDKGKSGDKIDGVVALVMAIGEMLTFEEEEKKPEFKFFMDFVSIK